MDNKPRGRPRTSIIRQNIVDLLYYMKKGYGYEIYKHYVKLFPRCTLRSIHYHLKFGSKIGEFDVQHIKEKGDFSWGEDVTKLYYVLGRNATPKRSRKIEEYFNIRTDSDKDKKDVQ
jgi:hypothetical protein